MDWKAGVSSINMLGIKEADALVVTNRESVSWSSLDENVSLQLL